MIILLTSMQCIFTVVTLQNSAPWRSVLDPQIKMVTILMFFMILAISRFKSVLEGN